MPPTDREREVERFGLAVTVTVSGWLKFTADADVATAVRTVSLSSPRTDTLSER